MSAPLLLDNSVARRLLMARQGLCGEVNRKINPAGLLELITGLGFVQVDSINTVARAHHMILFARNNTYRPAMLTRLLERDRSLFEHWTHDAALIPVAFYRQWQHRFRREEEALLARWRSWRREGFEEVFERVLTHVDSNGPTMARELGQGQKKSSGGWWDWHPDKTALEFHWRTGRLSITRREGFQKVYDLTERVIPQQYRAEPDDPQRFIDWACRSALQRLGTATSGEIAAFWDLVTPAEAAQWCREAQARAELVEILVAPHDGGRPRKSLAFADLADQLAQLPEAPGRLRILSPFDPLIRDRKRCERLFGFDYRIEIFVPAAKRKYGYYVFPMLEGERFVGRVDMKHIQERDRLEVTGLWMEPGVRLGSGRRRAIEAELERYRRFVGAAGIHVEDGVAGLLSAG